MRIKKGDNVRITKGKDRGKTGKVIQAFPDGRKIVVEGVNLMSKHMKVRKQGEKGQKIEFSGPISSANNMLICPKCAKPTRIGTKVLDDGGKKKKVRTCKKCKEVIE
ncbi:MAG TPA: 50S ribosomal protein L24 [Candidatus Eisenbacteria bacterium]|nr:50S ribosomal protein L24 [Candidatus Eisenbacteria bacterium]